MFSVFHTCKSKTSSFDNTKLRCHSTRLSQTQYSCPRVTEEDKLLFENTQLKYQLHQLDEEFKMYKLKQRQMKTGQGFSGEICFQLQNLRKLQTLNKQLEQELLQKVKDIEEMKKSMNLTKQQELQIECKEYHSECLRLRKQIQQLNQLLNYKLNGVNLKDLYEDLEKRLKKLQVETKQQQQLIQQLQSDITKYKNQIEKLELENKHLDRENKKQLLLISQVQVPQQNKFKNRLQIYRDEVEITKLQAKIMDLQQQLSNQQNYKEQYIQQLLKIINEKDDQLQAYELSNPNLIIKQATETQQLILDQKYQQCVQNIQSEKTIQDEIISDMPSQLNLVRQPSIRKKQHVIDYQKSFQIEMTSINGYEEDSPLNEQEDDDSTNKKEFKIQKLPKVNYYEVKTIGQKLKFQFQLKSIPLIYLDQLLNYYDDSEITIEEIIDILSKEPFMMDDEREKLLVARYLVEDNTQDYVLHSLKNSNSISIIKSVLKQLLGKYELFSISEKQNIEQHLKQIFIKHQYKIQDTLSQLAIKKNYSKQGECDNSDYEATLRFCEIQLQPRLIEYMEMINYNLGKNLDRINYKILIQYFCNTQS
ncbi:unnamed protein product [Paramecium primaurelia]|uniref:Uncharacterized protein n=1 Tax=Paramecium primaurelia TaxID=5886 RepID=A0A8S1LN03_PARPR|nr:unnamed protein product [Paramecium primaurelia]